MQKLVNPAILAAMPVPVPASKERLPAVPLGGTPEHNVAAPQTALKAPTAKTEVRSQPGLLLSSLQCFARAVGVSIGRHGTQVLGDHHFEHSEGFAFRVGSRACPCCLPAWGAISI